MTWYVCESPSADDGVPITDAIREEPVIQGEATRCPVCNRFDSLLTWLPPHRAELEVWGNHFADIAFTPGGSLLVSERFKGIYARAQLVGLLGFWPCHIVRARRRGGGAKGPLPEIPSYYVVHVARSRADRDEEASGLDRDPPGPGCPECHGGGRKIRWRGVVLKPRPLPVEDIFTARGYSGTPLGSERFVKVCKQHAVTGIRFIDASTYRYSVYGLDHDIEMHEDER